MNTTRAIKIGLAWINITYILCYVIWGLLPIARPSVLPYILHLNVGPVETIFTFGNFIGGLVLWNVITGAGIWFVGFLAKYIKN
ncbi:hypothetical protein A3D42_00985 [Candidatus Nomurabacteria bacterium RIFCSPHIGHO2_02_FULL_41_18]|uniref:Uncharacterized protein n=1 Tax=Candidatus Nomurabacteria bacterium RIFCSPHIGHO2_02_FULL_41_18 TaxID=1801754 RepID=A0A1F6W717_9BACT|nr:MAG: hypothetical protein A2737_03190 [Candidatus Nomurabacteria bacterium RIFCSPHIGHO2_01_FULL_41_71]OGI77556.1 MAG: hypothetical protein A3D42_00985 [Candidatus Nomurabacteria bacterium RIFCSPHIGHO2_02_FULL_41_18]OGI89056.1 MAG: hypothetical protein A3B01_00565 [Candidatus Nomurabacteria bacterium RIFCSPLOWO2_01_FULL_41_52b]OGJ00263.1 MAG: hypothetical protein A3I90_01580 [Candidatus Nomurabacteria bacterium RIFCSPLOWO2_02_FULL_41_9]